MTETPIRILLLDDHELFRDGLARLLDSEPGLIVSGSCATIDQALAVLSSVPVDIVLLDYDLGNEAGTQLLACMSVLQSPPRILLVTAGMTEGATRDALAAGAVGLVLKHSGPRYLIDAIRKAMTGELQRDTEALLQSLPVHAERHETGVLGDRPLTRRQTTALRGILDGLSNKEIAEQMKTSESSVKAILQELFHKAGVRTRSQLVRVAIEKHSSDWLL
jgi:two-component system, NarL family, nitrate/nitrite response regulator NarL